MKKYLLFITVFIYILHFIFLYAIASSDSSLTPKMLHEIKTMEKRHFKNKSNNNEDNNYRLMRLELELMGKSYENLPVKNRMSMLKVASQKKMLNGASISPSLNTRYITAKRINNDKIEIIPKNNDVGIIDGLMKVYAPDLFKAYRAQKERHFEIFED